MLLNNECSVNKNGSGASVATNRERSTKLLEKLSPLLPVDSSLLIDGTMIDSDKLTALAAVSFGSTDGKRMTIRKLPRSPSDFFRLFSTHSPPNTYSTHSDRTNSFSFMTDDDDYDDDDQCGDVNCCGGRASIGYHSTRHRWSSNIQLVLACISYSIGLGNIWRFPYLCYKSGGGGFLIPYFLILILCGIPMLYMELAIGQYIGRGPISAIGKICPLLKGTGLASVLMSFFMSTYYSVIIAYAIYYFLNAFKMEMPWTHCNNRWNSANCWTSANISDTKTVSSLSETPSEEFYKRKVLQMSEGIEVPGRIRWELLTYLLFAWILIYFSNWRSIKSSSKVRYFTAILAPCLIVGLLVKSLTLEGSTLGLAYFLYPKWSILSDTQVWVNAIAQNFNSFGIGFGSMICFSSYSRFRNNIWRDCVSISLVNAVASLLVGMLAFSTIGNIAAELNASIDDVISDGPGMIFILYPQTIAKMPMAQCWAIAFFFMLICFGLNSQFAVVEVVVSSLQDAFPRWIKKNLVYREILVLLVCLISFLISIPNITQGGIYFFQLIDHYTAQISILYVAFFELISVAWFYGIGRLGKNVQTMNGTEPNRILKLCWRFVTPITLTGVCFFYLFDYEAPSYDNGHYRYPIAAVFLGWTITSCFILCIPICAGFILVKCPGKSFVDKLKNSIKPDLYECQICGDNYCDHLYDENNEIYNVKYFVKISPTS